MAGETMISITTAEYNMLCNDSHKLAALEAAGVDNWEGYDMVMDILKEEGK